MHGLYNLEEVLVSAFWARYPEIVGSNPIPAAKFSTTFRCGGTGRQSSLTNYRALLYGCSNPTDANWGNDCQLFPVIVHHSRYKQIN